MSLLAFSALFFSRARRVSALRLSLCSLAYFFLRVQEEKREKARLVPLASDPSRAKKRKQHSTFSLCLLPLFPTQESLPSRATMEATVVVVDNSEWTRNGDYAPTRFQVSFFFESSPIDSFFHGALFCSSPFLLLLTNTVALSSPLCVADASKLDVFCPREEK